MVCCNIPKSGERLLAEVLQCVHRRLCADGCGQSENVLAELLFLPQEGLHARELINIFISVTLSSLCFDGM